MGSLLLKAALLVLLVLSSFLIFLKFHTVSDPAEHSPEKNITELTQKKEKNNISEPIVHECNDTLQKRYKTIASEIEDYMRALKRVEKEEELIKDINISKIKIKTPPPENTRLSKPVKKEKKKDELPKVVIIMDDICSKFQAKMIKNIPLKITPSIFPSSCDHPDTPAIAKTFKCFMVHTPMEAYHYMSPEKNTINTGDPIDLIDRRIKKIKEDFPNLTAINNHTGSMFTSDRDSMKNLFLVLKKYNIRFVDSRTSTRTKAKEIANEYNIKIFERNIFLDNIDDIDAILQRIRESIEYAKNHHLAIAICHPKESTFKALLKAKEFFKGVEVVYIDELYK